MNLALQLTFSHTLFR